MKIFNFRKKKIIIIYLIAIKLLFVAIQFLPANKPEIIVDNPNDLIASTALPKNIALILKTTCYDCHSNQTTLPWYSNFAPINWFVYKHVNEGRKELNFSNWNGLNKEEKGEKLDDISTMISGEEMPLKKYTLLHPKAKLYKEDREAIINWPDKSLDSLY